MINRVAFCGLANAGKDEAARGLLPYGYVRYSFGDIIKRQMNPLIQEHFGFPATTENRIEKAMIRGVLEQWGVCNLVNIQREYLTTLPEKCVNTRLCRVVEAKGWKQVGGVLIEIQRPGVEPATQWEAQELQSLRESGLIDTVIVNDGTVEELHKKVAVFAVHPISVTWLCNGEPIVANAREKPGQEVADYDFIG